MGDLDPGTIRRRAFEAAQGTIEVDQPLLRAVLSYAPGEEGAAPPTLEWLSLASASGSGVVRIRPTCAPSLAAGVPGPFGSTFYVGDHFEVVVPRRADGEGALMMLNLLDASAPSRFEFDTVLPDGWTMRLERDGSVTILDGGSRAQIYVSTPWAFDSDGRRLPARFVVEAGALVQHIDVPAGTSFPVLVDPDPDAVFTADGHLVTETWSPRLVPDASDISPGS